MVHSVGGWTLGVQVKLWEPLRTRAIPEHLKGVFTTRRYTNPRLPCQTYRRTDIFVAFRGHGSMSLPPLKTRLAFCPSGGVLALFNYQYFDPQIHRSTDSRYEHYYIKLSQVWSIVPHVSDVLASDVSTVAGLYRDRSPFLSYGRHTTLGAILTILGLNLDRCQVLLRHPHSQALRHHHHHHQSSPISFIK